MNDNDFDKLLQQLHDEIENTQNVGENEKTLLRHINKDIRELLERDRSEQAQAHPLTLERLEETIGLLEVSHPTLTNLMARLMAIL